MAQGPWAQRALRAVDTKGPHGGWSDAPGQQTHGLMGPWAHGPIGPWAHVYYAYYAVAIHVLLTLWSALPVQQLPFPIQRRPFLVQMACSSLQSEPTESTTYMIYQINKVSSLTCSTPPRLHVPLPNIVPSLSMPLATKGCRRVPQSANHYV